MPLEVAHRHNHVGVGHRSADFRRFAIRAAHHRQITVRRAFQPIGNNHRRLHGNGVEAVLPRALQVVNRIRPASRIQRSRIGKERLGAQ